MINILFDTNIILDIALKRKPFFEEARIAFEKIDSERIKGFVTATTITDIYYISKKEIGNNKSIEFIQDLISILDVAGVDRNIIEASLTSGFKDFEDAIQEYASQQNEVEVIVTRNVMDFNKSVLKILTPTQFIQFIEERAGT